MPPPRMSDMVAKTYAHALDSAPQDGRWLDDPVTMKKVVRFLLSKLSPADMAELDDHLSDGTEPVAQDSRIPAGRLRDTLLDYTPRARRALRKSLAGAPGAVPTMDEIRRADPMYGKSLEERFPGINRLKGY